MFGNGESISTREPKTTTSVTKKTHEECYYVMSAKRNANGLSLYDCMTWNHHDVLLKVRAASAGMITVLKMWVEDSVLPVDYLAYQATITEAYRSQVLVRWCQAIY